MRRFAATLVLAGLLLVPCRQVAAQQSRPASYVGPDLIDLDGLVGKTFPGGARPYHFFDPKDGNACEAVQRLQRARYLATDDIIAEIDGLHPERTELHDVLYDTLGLVKDPKTIDWLRKKISGPDAKQVFKCWLCRWPRTFLKEAGYWDLRLWLDNPDAWAQFFVDWARMPMEREQRQELLETIAASFDNDGVIAFFKDVEARSHPEDEELLIAQTYLFEHAQPIDSGKLALAILKSQGFGPGRLFDYARYLNHENLVPWLISALRDPRLAGRADECEELLQVITFQTEVKGADAWRVWYGKHYKDTRAQWASDTTSS